MNDAKYAQQQKEQLFELLTPGYGTTPRTFKKSKLNFLGEGKKRRKGQPEKNDNISFLSLDHRKSIYREDKLKMEIFHLFVELFCLEPPVLLKNLVDDVEKNIIVKILAKVEGNQKEAAKLLGIKYTTLNEKVKRYKIRFLKSPLASPPPPLP